eukprot:scaffold4920_cov99-Amphora_coffeaeformis.AAC.1
MGVGSKANVRSLGISFKRPCFGNVNKEDDFFGRTTTQPRKTIKCLSNIYDTQTGTTIVGVVNICLLALVGLPNNLFFKRRTSRRCIDSRKVFFSKQPRLCIPIMSPKNDTEPLVTVDSNGQLIYGRTKQGERMLDFSHCGYMGGGVALPDAVVKITLEPLSAPQDEDHDDTERIQAAIDSLGMDKVTSDKDVSAILLRAG